MEINRNIFKQVHSITKEKRHQQKKHKSILVWLCGLSGSGKSTVAAETEKKLFENDYHTYILDGDNMRMGLNKDLDFSREDRKENIRRIAEVGKLFVDAGVIVLTAFISPFRKERNMTKELLGNDYLEIYVNSPLEVCEQRDVKGLYKKARSGQIKNFTGIDSPFEAPENPDLELKTYKEPLDVSAEKLYNQIISRVLL